LLLSKHSGFLCFFWLGIKPNTYVMNDFAKKLYTDLSEELELIHDLGTLPVKRLSAAVSTVAEAVNKLKSRLNDHPFINEQDEVDFFKNWKPLFAAEQFYALEKFTIETNRPLTDSQLLKSYFEQELLFINRFFNQHQFLYQYYKFEFNELDQVLFVRGSAGSHMILPETPDLDPQFSTKGDHLFARFIAYEKLQVYLLEELKSMENPFKILNESGESSVDVKWTGETINLAELGYGVWLTGQVNNGNASITEIFECLERCFKVKLGTAFRRWQSISKRKRLGPTKYTDDVRAAILKRLDDENGR
jgi:hypothetical protein